MSTAPFRILIAGGGIAGIEAALAAVALAPEAEVELITPDDAFVYRQLSVVDPFARHAACVIRYELLGVYGVRVVHGSVAAVDPAARRVRLRTGGARHYDALVVATGAVQRPTIPHAITFTGPDQAGVIHGLVEDVERGWPGRIAFAVPAGVTWPLPLYELALQLAARSREGGIETELHFFTAEHRPLELFGSSAATRLELLLDEAGIHLHSRARTYVPARGLIATSPATEPLTVRRVIALPVLEGRPISGLPADAHNFTPVDAAGRVADTPGVYAAGDGTTGTVKQGGVAAQQAELAVAALLADAGLRAPEEPRPPTLRAMLIAGEEVWYLRREPGSTVGQVSPTPLWWPPMKVYGQRLSPFLDGHTGDLEREMAATQLEGRSP